MVQRIEISYKTIVFTTFFVIGLFLVWEIKDILFLLLLSFIAAAGLRTPVNWIEGRFRTPRVVAILVIYAVMLSILFLFLSFMIPAFASQATKLIQQLAYFFSVSVFAPYLDLSSARLTDQITSLSGNIYRATLGAFSILLNFFTFLVLTFYLLLERRHIRVVLKNLLGETMKERIADMLIRMEDRLGAWVRGEASLMIIIGVMSYVGLMLLGINFALPLAILAGILEIVPIVGPILSAIPAIIIALLVSPWLAVAVGALYFLIQQLENHLIVPVVMKQAVGVPPLVTILAILIGGRIAGISGALLAIPIFICVQIVFSEFFVTKEKTS